MAKTLRPEQIPHPATPEEFRGHDTTWHAGFEVGWLGNVLPGQLTPEMQAAAEHGEKAGQAARIAWDQEQATLESTEV